MQWVFTANPTLRSGSMRLGMTSCWCPRTTTGPPPKVIWLVVGNAGTDAIAELLLRNRDLIAQFAERPDDALLTLRASD